MGRKLLLVRLLLALIGFVGSVFAPVWVPIVAMILLALRFRAWEVLVLGLWIDFLWQPADSFFYSLPLFTILGAALFWVLEPLRRELLV